MEDIKEYYLIIWDKDWGDEFNTFGFDVIEKSIYTTILDLLVMEEEDNEELCDKLSDALSGEYGFGTNEEHYFELNDIKEVFEDAILLSQNQFEVLLQLFGSSYWRIIPISEGINFTDSVIERLSEEGLLEIE